MIDISVMRPDERLALMDQLWISLAANPEVVPVTDAQRRELERRLDLLEENGSQGRPIGAVIERLKASPN